MPIPSVSRALRLRPVALAVTFALAPGAQDPSPSQQQRTPQPPQDPKPHAQAPAEEDKPAVTNRLQKESSPYLRQHRHNPVDWYAWGPEALALAKRENKPIFLSIGYSACHWCHVMAAESFADPDIAKLMNDNFVCIKVDREERPDLDEIYMSAVQAMGQQGGWPLSVWLTPDGRPFYGGTYFPPEDGNGRPGFRRVCEALGKAWRERRDEVIEGADELSAHLGKVLAPQLLPGEPTADLLPKALEQARERFDAEHPGFGYAPHYAPKFPHSTELQVLLRLDDEAAQKMAVAVLDAMQRGGMHDQLGGGFHRYSTDRAWLVPHFEKMLYDNALLASCYLEAHLLGGQAEFAEVARRTLDYMLRELQAPAGGFYASQDAQSEGVEGKFFVWQKSEIDRLLADDAELFERVYGVTADGNWEHRNVLWLAAAMPTEPATIARLQRARAILFAARAERVAPATDDKVLAAWNGLALGAMCSGYRVLQDERYLVAAQRAAGFLVDKLVTDGRVRRSWQGGEARHQGTLEDYASLADGLLSVFECDGDPHWLATARSLLLAIEQHFGADDGAFFFTADDHEELLARTKSAVESSTPSGTALAARAFLRGGLLLGDERLYEIGVGALRAHHQLLRDTPAAAPSLVLAMQFHLGRPREVVVAGEPDDARTQALLRAAWRMFPQPVVVALVHDGNRERLAELSPVFTAKLPVDGVPAVYICERGVCQAPVTSPEQLGTTR